MRRLVAASESSLLYPLEGERLSNTERWGENATVDLGLDEIASALSLNVKYRATIKSILLELCQDTRVIDYRQSILEDCLNSPNLVADLSALLPLLEKLQHYAETRSHDDSLQETLGRLAELHTYVTCVRQMQAALANNHSAVHAPGLLKLQRRLEQIMGEEIFQALEKNLPELLAQLQGIPSVTIGVNLDSELQPVEATLLAIHDKPFKGSTLFDRLLGGKSGRNPTQGLGPLHTLPYKHIEGIDNRVVKLSSRVEAWMSPLFKDLQEILRSVIAPLAAALSRYAQVKTSFLLPLEEEMAFYLGAAALVRRMGAAGLPMCRAQVLPPQARTCQMKGMYNLVLVLHRANEMSETALGKTIVPNDVDFGAPGRIFILTGPNQGGKTIYVQAVGIAQLLFQAGLPVPAEQAALSPVDGLHTHFASMEKVEGGMGRLGEEAERLSLIFQRITEQSLVLLNESLAGTSPDESLYLARDVVRALRLFGVRAIYATHLHELAEGAETINAEVTGDSRVVNLVAGVALPDEAAEAIDEMVPRTYQIRPGPPRGLSYARGIANRHGISFEQLTQQWQGRKLRPTG